MAQRLSQKAMQSGSQRKREGAVRVLGHTGRDLKRASPDVEHQQSATGPAEPATYRKKRQPRFVRAAQHLQVDAGPVQNHRQDFVAVRCVSDRRRREGQQLFTSHLRRNGGRLTNELCQGPCPGLADRAVRLQQLGEPQFRLVRVC